MAWWQLQNSEVSAVKLSFSRGLSYGKSRGVEPGKPRWHRAQTLKFGKRRFVGGSVGYSGI